MEVMPLLHLRPQLADQAEILSVCEPAAVERYGSTCAGEGEEGLQRCIEESHRALWEEIESLS